MALSLAVRRASQLPRIAPLVQRRWTSTVEAAIPTVAKKVESKSSMLPRVLGFSAFTLILGTGAAAFTLATDEATLFLARDKVPWLVNAIAPFIGIPQELDRGELIFKDDDDETGPTDVKQVVGDAVYVTVKLASGRVHVLQCNSHERSQEIEARIAQQFAVPGDRVVEIGSLDAAKAEELAKLTPEQLFEKMTSIKIPEIPQVVTLHSLGVALELCRHSEIDLEVRLRLNTSESTAAVLKRGLAQLEERKTVLKKMVKDEKKRQGIGFLASMFRRY